MFISAVLLLSMVRERSSFPLSEDNFRFILPEGNMILIADRTSYLSNLLKSEPAYAYDCICCNSFSAAINHVEKQGVRIVIVAQNLSDRHGFELLSHLQTHFPT